MTRSVYWEVLHREVEGHESEHEKGWEVALKFLIEAAQFGFSKLLVSTDSWFAGEEFFEGLRQAGFSFVIEIRSNRIVMGKKRSDHKDVPVSNYFAKRD